MCRSDDKQVCAVGGEEHEEDSGSFYDLLYSGDEADEGEESRKKRARVEERPADNEEEEETGEADKGKLFFFSLFFGFLTEIARKITFYIHFAGDFWS